MNGGVLMKKMMVMAAAVIGLAASSFSSVIVFDLLGDSSLYSLLDDRSSGSVTNSGLAATLSASDGVLNRTTDGFGINGIGTDDTDALNLGQYIDVVFGQAVVFSNLNVSSWGLSSAGEVQLGSAFVSQGSILGTGDTAYGFQVAAGQVVRILATAETGSTNGFSVDGFTVETIPEPAVMGLVGLVGLGFLAARRFLEK